VFRGSSIARVDEKGRIKIPSHFRQFAETQYGNEFYITSFNGKFARLYPLPVWIGVEKWIDAQPEFDPDIQHFQEMLTYWGAMATMDAQGRILLPAKLRGKAGLVEEVTILGQSKHMDVWNKKTIDERIESNEMTDEKLKTISERARRES
jgi:MraZ protein